jgi:hypothetical protein
VRSRSIAFLRAAARSARASHAPGEPRIEQVPPAVAQEVDREHRGGQEQPGEAEFQKIAAEILYVAPPDVFSNVPFMRIPRPKWPLDPDAFADLEAAGLLPAGANRLAG